MKNKKAKAQKVKRPSTQAHLPITEIKDGVAILKDGTLRSVLLVSSVNFALKSEDEQNAVISAYVGFLNSIDFPLQIVVQSRQLYIQPYLDKLQAIEKEEVNELMQTQIADYRAFVQELVEIGKIMTKRFYVVVPYDPLSNRKKSFFERFKEVAKPAITVKLKEKKFQKRKYDLDLRVRQVQSGLESVGLQVVQLDTQALIELYYSTYNPDISLSQQLDSVEKLQINDM
ncbi:MAG: hypothetical protein GW939_00270 [Candidatus Magasanikbacteria bacterium]|uniref:TraC-like domain-containing protein n=1 Tax=Candidatus Magasanikbacteria bacterium CG10_big_fil_rev_8_21_14_0_10_38_6 TaxID=1974647 RepID=A0A2M6NZN0_9BACT|nr:hypothetical protein [Candidatus Magasanikbacteria bacterium]PIR76901.1 MAG: hypothetical protein COU30_05355 [Candidatus Magasanikbacteria bacterium CG10_big_fil_rev_8_21_14_0_10_38_6]